MSKDGGGGSGWALSSNGVVIPKALSEKLSIFGGTVRIDSPELAFDAAPEKDDRFRFTGFTLVVLLLQAPATTEAVHEIGQIVQTEIEQPGIDSVAIEVDGIRVRGSGRQAGLKAAAALEAALAGRREAQR